LPWLNDLPDVRQILADHFAARPISPQNLSNLPNGPPSPPSAPPWLPLPTLDPQSSILNPLLCPQPSSSPIKPDQTKKFSPGR
jgi:hypothetical protein